MTMRVLIVDDEAPARARLMRLVAAIPNVELVGQAEDGEAAVQAITSLAPDLVPVSYTHLTLPTNREV